MTICGMYVAKKSKQGAKACKYVNQIKKKE